MITAPLFLMVVVFLVALFLWSVGSYNAAIIMIGIAGMLGVVALVAKRNGE